MKIVAARLPCYTTRPMSLPQRVLCVLAVSLVALGCSSSEGGAPSGQALYRSQGCTACHGTNRRGSALAPSLEGIAPHWTVDGLVLYLADPPAYAAQNTRLHEQGKGYVQPMPKYGALAAEERALIARWLLERQ